MGLGGVTVQLSGVSDASAVTDDNGQYAFTGLRMGNYSVDISGFNSDEVGFSATAAAVTVGVGESKIISFDGTYLRTAGIMGRVSVEGAGLEGVMVSLAGGPDNTDMTTETDAAGQYSFAKLRAGDYAVGISGYNTDDYEFELTSQNVTVALGETANVPFEGVLLRTSGISGRVSVEGMGLEGIAVTLSMADAEDMTAMTDAGGLYAFAGLAAGDYTVGIAVASEAYVFETMSMDVTLGDDETQVVNFEGAHARTASVSGRLFIDELMKNDSLDAGEHPLPHAGVPVVLVGPGVNDQLPSATDSTGAYTFMGLKAGNYQLVVPVTGPMGDFAYGGSATGYPLEVGVGAAVMQNIPIDITHTTVHFGVTLKHGETRGMPLPGATVTLYADAMGETKVGEGMTMVNEETMHAVASIRVPRAGTSGNMVHAGVAAEGYDVAAGMTPVPWDPQKTYTQGGNANDIVNLNVDVTYGGATIETEYGGGAALAGWAVSVAHGDTMYADTLDAMGMAAFKMTVDSAGALPVMFAISADTIQDDMLDGGEMFEGTSVDYVHTGLTLAGTMDAGSLEVAYTTQTLTVSAHHERDQVMGYTGNVLDGDVRDAGTVHLAIRYIDGNGRSRSFTKAQWDAVANTSASKGVTTFAHLPADANIIVQASVAADAGVKLLDPDELAAYTGTDANGITGGHFGAHGGYSNTVSLCPLQATNPQDHGECSSFAYVSTYSVGGLVWKNSVSKKGDDFEEAADPTFVDGISVSLTPDEGKNLAGEVQAFTTLKKNDTKNDHPDDTHHFQFNGVAAGAYTLSVPAGWRARMSTSLEGPDIKGSEVMLGDALNPLGANLGIDVTPATRTVYGRIDASDGFGLDSVTVTVNGVTAMTDALGRYIAEGVSAETRKIGTVTHTSMIFVEATREGRNAADTIIGFVANDVERVDLTLEGVSKTASVSGTVTASGTGAPVAGVSITVDGGAPENAATSGANKGKLLTGADGSFTAIIEAKNLGQTSYLSASKAGMNFSPASYPVAAHSGANTSGVAFTGYLHASISGRVIAPGGGPQSGVAVKAVAAGDTTGTAVDADTTGVTGTYSLSVPFGNYNLEAEATDHTFSYPNNVQAVNVGPGQSHSYGDIQGLSPKARDVSAVRTVTDSAYNGQVTVRWTAESMDVPADYNEATYEIQTNATSDGEFADATGSQVVADSSVARFTGAQDTAFMVRVVATAQGTGADDLVLYSDPVMVGAIAPNPTAAAARSGDTIQVSWKVNTNTNTNLRVVVQVSAASNSGNAVWLVADPAEGQPTTIGDGTRAWNLVVADDFDHAGWVSVDGATFPVDAADLNKALMVRVEARQGDEMDEDGNEVWRSANSIAIAAKPAG